MTMWRRWRRRWRWRWYLEIDVINWIAFFSFLVWYGHLCIQFRNGKIAVFLLCKSIENLTLTIDVGMFNIFIWISKSYGRKCVHNREQWSMDFWNVGFEGEIKRWDSSSFGRCSGCFAWFCVLLEWKKKNSVCGEIAAIFITWTSHRKLTANFLKTARKNTKSCWKRTSTAIIM